MNDPWELANAREERDKQERSERQRQTIARLLLARGHQQAAAIIALAQFETYIVDSWGNDYTENGVLRVPVEVFDRIDEQSQAVIDKATGDVVGSSRYGDLEIEIQLSAEAQGWDRELLEHLKNGQPSTTNLSPPESSD